MSPDRKSFYSHADVRLYDQPTKPYNGYKQLYNNKIYSLLMPNFNPVPITLLVFARKTVQDVQGLARRVCSI